MGTLKTVTLVCDLCYSEDDVETHSASLDRKAVEIELCERCHGKAETALGKVLSLGRRPGAKIPKAPRRQELASKGA